MDDVKHRDQLDESEQMDLFEYWVIIKRNLLLVSTVFTLVVAVFVTYALLSKPVYQADVLLSPSIDNKKNSGFNSIINKFGALGSMAGLSAVRSGDLETNLATLRSRVFTRNFIEKHNMKQLLFSDLWDFDENKWKSDDPKLQPDEWTTYRLFWSIVNIENNSDTGLLVLSVVWEDPQLASDWANLIVHEINNYLRKETIEEGERSIEFLKKEISETHEVELREVMYSLIASELQKVKLAHVRQQFAFRVVDPSIKPKYRIKPKRKLIVMVGGVLGGLLGLVMAIIKEFVQNNKHFRFEKRSPVAYV